ncbi:YqjF family protein [Thalassobacillus pellis]|uniref:YqjF family protein n=1 Tax=Thalassobacillus pellis TaxID=748008 RepID=UPI00195F6858|nr:DUF2071 domain-containing protein [Thalassobacillus pellis]MBM7553118.1 uncharacterized protein YqjF (DUF2071 family) [Thalassobacillus pellis]
MYKEILQTTNHRTTPLPKGSWVMTQEWKHLLFMHVPVSKEWLSAYVPDGLEIDTYHKQAWVTIIPFQVSDMRLRMLPSIPGLKSYLELNVRTYVIKNGIPGIYFFSLDADKLMAVIGARFATLPYFPAKMTMKNQGGAFTFKSDRWSKEEAVFQGSYQPSSKPFSPEQDSLPFWLLERYYLYSRIKGRLFYGGIHHLPWKITEARAEIHACQLFPISQHQLTPADILFHYAPSCRALFWPIKTISMG